MNLRIRTFIVIMSIVMLFGCASTSENLSETKKASLRSIKVVDAEQIPTEIYYQGPEHAFGGAIGGVIGALLAEGASTTGDQIALYIKNNGIDIQEIFHKEFMSRLKASASLRDKVAQEEQASETEIKLVIVRYGFGQPHGFSSIRKPLVIGYVEIKNGAEEIIWQGAASVIPLNGDTYGTSLEEYFSSPVHFEKSFSTAFRIISDELIRKIE